MDGHGCLASLWSGRFDGQGPAAHLVVLDRDEMANDVRFDARPDAFEGVPELWPGPTQPEVDHTGMRPGVRLDESADVAIEGDQDPALEPAHGDQILVGGLVGDDGASITSCPRSWSHVAMGRSRFSSVRNRIFRQPTGGHRRPRRLRAWRRRRPGRHGSGRK